MELLAKPEMLTSYIYGPTFGNLLGLISQELGSLGHCVA